MNFDAIIKAAREGMQPVEIDPNKIYVSPNDGEIFEGHRFLPNPIRPHGVINAHDVPSFLKLWKTYATEHSRLYVDRSNAVSFVAVLNEAPDAKTAAWRDWRLTLRLQCSPQYIAWSRQAKTYMDQEAFANFLEEHLADIVEPAAADMLQMVQTISANARVSVDSVIGEDGKIVFRTSNEQAVKAGRGNASLPRQFSIGIPIFRGREGFKIKMALRWRLGEGKVSLAYSPLNLDTSFEAEVDKIVAELEAGGVVLVNGSPG